VNVLVYNIHAGRDAAGIDNLERVAALVKGGKAGKSAMRSTGRAINLPAAVLVDNGSASASEVLAGAIQDYKAAPLVGVKSFGKGTVQQILYLSTGGGMKVTIAEYLTAKERHVHGIGLTPDYVVENPKPTAEHTAPLELKRDERPILPSTAGLDVLYIQYRLKDLGYQPDMTGFFGIGTVDAVTKFRTENGLTAECKVDQSFVNVLNRRVNEHWKAGQAGDLQMQKAVSLVQEQLKQ
jgi:carboxyl-terminal processing protease